MSDRTTSVTRIFHATYSKFREAIKTNGFKNGTNHEGLTGVWFSVPAVKKMETEEHGFADIVLSIAVPDGLLSEFEERDDFTVASEKFAAKTFGQRPSFRTFRLEAEVANRFLPSLEENLIETQLPESNL